MAPSCGLASAGRSAENCLGRGSYPALAAWVPGERTGHGKTCGRVPVSVRPAVLHTVATDLWLLGI